MEAGLIQDATGTIKRRSGLIYFIAAAVVFLPFNALPYFHGPFGELSVEGAFYPLLIAVVLVAVTLALGASFHLPRHLSVVLLGAFLVWAFCSLIVNEPTVALQTIKGRTGAEKAALQILLTVFVVAATLTTYHLASTDTEIFALIRRAALISVLIAGAYSVFELMYFAGSPAAVKFLEFTHPLIRNDDSPALYIGRIRSVSGEASWFAMYCGFIGPWLYGGMRKPGARGLGYMLLVAYFLVLVGLTWSRTALAIVSMQILLFFLTLLTDRSGHAGRSAMKFLVTIAAVVFFVFIAAESGLSKYGMGRNGAGAVSAIANRESLANQGRFGSQVAALNMAIDHPMFGVGLGQYGFHMGPYVPLWASTSEEVQSWESFAPGTAWAPVQGIYPRIAAETGFVGLALWLALWLTVAAALVQRLLQRRRITGAMDNDGTALLLSLMGVLLSGFNADSFRFFGYWLILPLTWIYLQRRDVVTSNRIVTSNR